MNSEHQELASFIWPVADLVLGEAGLAGIGARPGQRRHRLAQRTKAQARLLAERRQALITAAVTGQIDVTTARGLVG